MTFVIIFLIDAKVHVVVDENCVKGLNSAKTKNNGKNSNQVYLAFWKATNGKATVLSANEIDFRTELRTVYEPTCEGACYKCNVVKFEGKFIA